MNLWLFTVVRWTQIDHQSTCTFHTLRLTKVYTQISETFLYSTVLLRLQCLQTLYTSFDSVRHYTATCTNALAKWCTSFGFLKLVSKLTCQEFFCLAKWQILTYSWLPITRILTKLNLALTQSNFHFPSGKFLYNLPSINQTSDDSNLFLFPLKAWVIRSWL